MDEIAKLTEQVIGAAIEVHRAMGPGLIESVYHKCMEIELEQRGLKFISPHKVPVVYKGYVAPDPLEIDIYFPGQLVLELKAVQEIHPVFKATLLSYLKLTNTRVGLLINFHEVLLKNGIIRMVF